MRTLHFTLEVTDVNRSLAFYGALGFAVVGTVPGSPEGDLTMLKLPDDAVVTVELVARSSSKPALSSGPSQFVVQVDSMRSTFVMLEEAGIQADPPQSPDGTDDFLTTHLTDPDGHRIELVQWPPAHADGLTAEDWAEHADEG